MVHHSSHTRRCCPRAVEQDQHLASAYKFKTDSICPDSIRHAFAPDDRLLADVLARDPFRLPGGGENLREKPKLDGEHGVRGREEREGAQIVARAVVRPHHTCGSSITSCIIAGNARGPPTRIRLGLAVPAIVYGGTQGAGLARPVVVRNEVKVLVEGGLRLLIDDAEDLVDGAVPCVAS